MTQSRVVPANDLDLNWLMTETSWGKESSPELDEQLTRDMPCFVLIMNEQGGILKDEDGMAAAFTPNHEGNLISRMGNILVDSDKTPIRFSSKRSLWGLHSFYKRDLRLGNLSEWNNELKYCMFWLDYAADLLSSGYTHSFMTALSRVISRLELSQSKGGFLRMRQSTLTSEQKYEGLHDEKKGFFGGKAKKQ